MGTALLMPKASGPLERFEMGFAEQIALFGYGRRHVRTLKLLFKEFDRWLAVSKLQAENLRLSDVDRFLADRVSAGQKVSITKRAMKPLLGYLRDIGITLHDEPDDSTPGSMVQINDRFRRYLSEERGVTSAVANQYVSQVRPFMEAYVSASGDGAEDFKGLDEADVIAFVVANCPRMGRGRASLVQVLT